MKNQESSHCSVLQKEDIGLSVLKVAQDVFQEMDVILAGCKGTINISDDIVVFGSSVEEHDCNLYKLMSRAWECGLVFNPEKCVRRSEFLG